MFVKSSTCLRMLWIHKIYEIVFRCVSISYPILDDSRELNPWPVLSMIVDDGSDFP